MLTLSGEADLTTVAELTEALTAQLAIGARHLTVDLSRLRFADSSVIRALVLADRTLKQRGGGLALAHPQPGRLTPARQASDTAGSASRTHRSIPQQPA